MTCQLWEAISFPSTLEFFFFLLSHQYLAEEWHTKIATLFLNFITFPTRQICQMSFIAIWPGIRLSGICCLGQLSVQNLLYGKGYKKRRREGIKCDSLSPCEGKRKQWDIAMSAWLPCSICWEHNLDLSWFLPLYEDRVCAKRGSDLVLLYSSPLLLKAWEALGIKD